MKAYRAFKSLFPGQWVFVDGERFCAMGPETGIHTTGRCTSKKTRLLSAAETLLGLGKD